MALAPARGAPAALREQHLTPTVKTSGLSRRPKARGDLGGTGCSQWGGAVGRWGALASEAWLGLSSSSTFLDSGFLEALLKLHCCWRLWGHLLAERRTGVQLKSFI